MASAHVEQAPGGGVTGPRGPYDDLRGQFEARRSAYLTALTANDDEFARDPLTFGTAHRRGYLRSPRSAAPGPKPSYSFAEQDAAGDAAGKNLALWTDNPGLRAGPNEPWDDEDVRLAVARLTVHEKPVDFLAHIWMSDEPPPADSTTGLSFQRLSLLGRQIGVINRATIRTKARGALLSAVDTGVGLPDYNPQPTFDAAVADEIAAILDGGGLADGLADTDKAIGSLAGLTVEPNYAAAETIDADRARRLVADLGRIIPGRLVDALIAALVERAHPGPYVLPPEQRPPPSSWEPPPPSYERPPDTRERPPEAGWEKPPSTYEDPNAKPKPPPPRPHGELLWLPWAAITYLAALGRLSDPTWTVRRALKGLKAWGEGGVGDQFLAEVAVDTSSDVLGDIFGRDGIPDEFAYPGYSRLGIYWWRAVVRSHCIEHCFALKDTADFHSTDLIRFLVLTTDGDPRLDPAVREAARLALQYLKYWIDQPAAAKIGGGDRDEMTFWSENHQILFAQSELFAALLLPDRQFPRGGTGSDGAPLTGAGHLAGGLQRTERWLDRRLRFGLAEWNAPGYYNEDIPPLCNLAEFSDRSWPGLSAADGAAVRRIGVKAAMMLDAVVFDLARFTCRGSFGAAAGRAYWEHKAYGWEQSVGDTIELLFGTRGDFLGAEPAAIALATCRHYQVPDALLAIGLDRRYVDRDLHFTDRTRVSITFEEGKDYGVGLDSDEDAFFWWSLGAFFTTSTLELTKAAVENHPNLRDTAPFELLYSLADNALYRFLADVAGAMANAVKIAEWVAIPFPANVVMMFLTGDNIVEDLWDFLKDVWDAIKTFAHEVVEFVADLFGIDHSDDRPRIPDTTLQKILEALLIVFNQGSVLSRANIVNFSDGDTMLSSTQVRAVGVPSAQTQPVQATLGCEACVWTTARFMNADLGSYIAGAETFLRDMALVRVDEALVDVAAPVVFSAFVDDPFGHDGPNYWTGSLVLPMVVQHERAAIAIYDIKADLRKFSGAATHAWFPTAMFDHTDKEDSHDGTWFFGRKDTYTPDGSARTGSGYVALFSALQAGWTGDDDGPNPWAGKEIQAKGGSNIWIYVVGNEHDFGDFDSFRREVLDAYLNVSGVGTPNGLECSFDIPRCASPPGATARLEAFYGDRRGRFAGVDLAVDDFPRYENRYVRQISATRRPSSGGGVSPQVETLTSSATVGFGSTAYTLVHPLTGLTIDHDLVGPSRAFSTQAPQQASASTARRLVDGSITPIRLVTADRHRQAVLHRTHLDALSRPNALPRKAIRWPSIP